MSHLIVVPAFNCSPQIPRVLSRLHAAPKGRIDRVLVVDNRSTDDTLEQARRAAPGPVPVVLARNPANYGLGGSQKVGFQHAMEHGFSRVTVLHGDDQGDIGDLWPVLDCERVRGADALLGARFMAGSHLRGYSSLRALGNRAYNQLFSAACGIRVHDLGSGLNSYSTGIFSTGFHLRFPDDLTFNYCMVLAHAYLRHDAEFFPIGWREFDQVSNVRLVRQSFRVLALLASFARNPSKFMSLDHRAEARPSYPTQVVFSTQ
jgi:glycosyltransferase involved in cell wall biosynthesis